MSNLPSTKIYHCSIAVRGYELDSFGHVNHSVYIQYLEHARWKLLEDEGVKTSMFVPWSRWPIIAKVSATYIKPAYLGDELDVQTHILEYGKANILFEQKILRGHIVVLKAEVLVVIINEKGRPSEMPDMIKRFCVSDRETFDRKHPPAVASEASS